MNYLFSENIIILLRQSNVPFFVYGVGVPVVYVLVVGTHVYLNS